MFLQNKWRLENLFLETKVRSQNLAITLKNCLPTNWAYTHNIGSGLVARAILTWNSSLVKSVLISSSDQQITDYL